MISMRSALALMQAFLIISFASPKVQGGNDACPVEPTKAERAFDSCQYFQNNSCEIDPKKLPAILDMHSKWLKTEHKEGKRAILSWADLRQINFAKSTITLADADLSHSNLNSATLSGVDLESTDLGGACLAGAHLEGSDLRGADLTNANLSSAFIESAEFSAAEVEGLLFEPQHWEHTPAGIDMALGIGHLRIARSFSALDQLRHDYSVADYPGLNRQVSVSVRRHTETALQKLVFDWTCEWGSNWIRPLVLAATLVFVCAIIYWLGLFCRPHRSGLFIVTTGRRVRAGARARVRRVPVRRSGFQLLLCAVSFSAMSTIALGYGSFQPYGWSRMLSTAEYEIKPSGWFRAVSGFQSLAGLTLTSIAVITGLFQLFF